MRFFGQPRVSRTVREGLEPGMPLHVPLTGDNASTESEASSTSSPRQQNWTETKGPIVPIDQTAQFLPAAAAINNMPADSVEDDDIFPPPTVGLDAWEATKEQKRHHALACAWLERRQQVKRSAAHPVDVDSGLEWSASATTQSTSRSRSPSPKTVSASRRGVRRPRSKAAVKVDNIVHNCGAGDDNATFASAALSDQTPVVSNRLFPSASNGKNTEIPKGDGSLGSTQPEPEQPESFFDLKSKHGKLVYVLIVLLVIAFTVIVVSLVTAQSHQSGSSNKGTFPEEGRNSTTVTDVSPTRSPAAIVAATATPTPSATTASQDPTPPTSAPESIISAAPDVSLTAETTYPSTLRGSASTPPTSTRPIATTKLPVPASAPVLVAPVQITPQPTSIWIAPTTVPTSIWVAPTTYAPTSIWLPPTAYPSLVPSTSPRPTTSQLTEAPTVHPWYTTLVVSTDTIKANMDLTISSESHFGSSIALSTNRLVVGAPNFDRGTEAADVGWAQVYSFGIGSSADWQPLGKAVMGDSAGSTLGSTVALEGSHIAVAEPTYDSPDRNGRVRVYEYSSESGELEQMGSVLIGNQSAHHFGIGLALSGNRLAVGAPYASGQERTSRFSGTVSVYEYVESDWQPMGSTLVGSFSFDWLGSAVELLGDVLVASAPRNPRSSGYVRAWKWDKKEWVQLGKDIVNTIGHRHSDRFGHSLSLSKTVSGQYRLAIGAPEAKETGIVAVYTYSDKEKDWIQLGDTLVGSVEQEQLFGFSVSLLRGEVLAVGAPDKKPKQPGTVFLYHYINGQWVAYSATGLVGALAGDGFGHQVALAASATLAGSFTLAASAVQDSNGGPGYVATYQSSSPH